MDAAALLRQARVEAGLSQRLLAKAAGTSRSTVAGYESGAMSPTVRQLDRLLAACGLQVRPVLERQGADVDEALEAALAGTADLHLDDVLRFAASLDAAEVSWAVDGATAVALQGLAVEHRERCVAVVDNDAARRWLRSVWARGTNRDGFPIAPSWDESAEMVRVYVRHQVYTRLGFVKLRFLDEAPDAVSMVVGERLLPVLPLLALERYHGDLAALLAAYRARCA